MWRVALLTMTAACWACSAPDQDSVRTVAAIEIPLTRNADRLHLIGILRKHAAFDSGLHVDDATKPWRELETRSNDTPVADRGTIFVGVWRGEDDHEIIATVDDSGHPGRPWVIFSKGENVELAAKFKDAVLADIKASWPDAKTLPVLPSGGLPLMEDLRLTPTGYKVAPEAAVRYELPPTSPLLDDGPE